MSDRFGDKSLNYGIIGPDSSTDLDKLEKYTGEVSWDYLEKHYRSGALLYIDPSLDLIVVGKAFAEDDVDSVAEWKKTGDMVKPSAPHAAFWQNSNTHFKALVVSPFVLIQPIDLA